MGRTSNARQLLLDAALNLFWERSYYSVSVDNICEAAGVKKGSFYHFFSSKAELAAEAIEFHWQENLPGIMNIFSDAKAPLDRIRDYVNKGYLHQKQLKESTGCTCGCPYFDLGAESAAMEKDISDRITKIISEIKALLAKSIRDASEQGLISSSSPDESAHWIFCLLEGALTNARIHNDPELLKDIYPAVLRLLDAK